jgi:hypothetical protein
MGNRVSMDEKYAVICVSDPTYFRLEIGADAAAGSSSRTAARQSVSDEQLHIGRWPLEIPPYQTKTSMRLWQGMARVRILLVSDKAKLSDVRKKGQRQLVNSFAGLS